MNIKTNFGLILLTILSTNLFAQSWDNMQSGVTGHTLPNGALPSINDIICYQGRIIACGTFLNAGGISTNNIASWNGNNWDSLGIGLYSSFYHNADTKCLHIKEYKSKLYGCGWFDGAGGSSFYDTAHVVIGISKWDGTDFYPLLPHGNYYTGLGNTPVTMTEYKNKLYIGGGFNSFWLPSNGGHLARGIVRWDDTTFSNCGYFDSNGSDFIATSSIVYNNKLIEAGEFNSINGSPYGMYGYIGAYNDTIWSTLSVGLNAPVFALSVFNGDLYAGGVFTATGDGLTLLNHIAKWDGIQWSAVGEGLNDTVLTLTVDSAQSKLVAGGLFTQTGLGITAKHLAEWNGTNWQELGGGVNGPVTALLAKDSNLYVGGLFNQIGGTTAANNIACWGPSHVGVDDISASSTTMQLEIYPNPSNGEFTIESTSKIESIKVFNILGETIYQTAKDNLQATINLSSQPKGIYFVQVKTEKGILNRKIVIQ